MQALIELLAGFIALLISAALGQFGVNIERPRPVQPEVHRVSDCPQKREAAYVAVKRQDC